MLVVQGPPGAAPSDYLAAANPTQVFEQANGSSD